MSKIIKFLKEPLNPNDWKYVEESTFDDLNSKVADIENHLFGCLIEGTKIAMADGTEKNIEDIQNGDMVQSWDIDNNCLFAVPALCNVKTGAAREYNAYLFENGSYLTIYDPHHIYSCTTQAPKRATSFKISEKSIAYPGQELMYVGFMKQNLAKPKSHYTLLTANNLYFANGILCGHNADSKNTFAELGRFTPTEEEKAIYELDAEPYRQRRENKFNPEFLKEAGVLRGRKIRIQNQIDSLKKRLTNTDYKALKFFEGLIDTDEWSSAQSDRAEWREKINEREEKLVTINAEYEAIKQKYFVDKSPVDCFHDAYKRDMEYLRSRLETSKAE